jgi:hypothetical protein
MRSGQANPFIICGDLVKAINSKQESRLPTTGAHRAGLFGSGDALWRPRRHCHLLTASAC